MNTDPIADMLTRIRNAQTAGHVSVEVPFSKLKGEIAKQLMRLGFIKSYELYENKTLLVYLKYDLEGYPVIKGLKRVSKPGLRVYSNKNNLPRVMAGAGAALISTSKGILSDHEARNAGYGGEVLCYVY